MYRFGRYLLYVGLVLGLIGLFGGFGLMFLGIDAWAKPLIAMIPVGFLLVFTGLVTTLLHSAPQGQEPRQPPD